MILTSEKEMPSLNSMDVKLEEGQQQRQMNWSNIYFLCELDQFASNQTKVGHHE